MHILIIKVQITTIRKMGVTLAIKLKLILEEQGLLM
jgi:hypothetical protein